MVLLVLDPFKLGQVFAYLVAHAELAFGCDDLIVLLILELLVAERVITGYLPALDLVGLDLREPVLLLTELALDAEGVNDLAHHPGGATDADVLVTHRTVLV